LTEVVETSLLRAVSVLVTGVPVAELALRETSAVGAVAPHASLGGTI
jgi:hypothetical protein